MTALGRYAPYMIQIDAHTSSIHQLTEGVEYRIGLYLAKLAQCERGFPIDAPPFATMARDEKTLRQLADRIASTRQRLIAETRHLQAAE